MAMKYAILEELEDKYISTIGTPRRIYLTFDKQFK